MGALACHSAVLYLRHLTHHLSRRKSGSWFGWYESCSFGLCFDSGPWPPPQGPGILSMLLVLLMLSPQWQNAYIRSWHQHCQNCHGFPCLRASRRKRWTPLEHSFIEADGSAHSRRMLHWLSKAAFAADSVGTTSLFPAATIACDPHANRGLLGEKRTEWTAILPCLIEKKKKKKKKKVFCVDPRT